MRMLQEHEEANRAQLIEESTNGKEPGEAVIGGERSNVFDQPELVQRTDNSFSEAANPQRTGHQMSADALQAGGVSPNDVQIDQRNNQQNELIRAGQQHGSSVVYPVSHHNEKTDTKLKSQRAKLGE